MNYRRYKEAYELVTGTDPYTGKPTKTTRYIGDYYGFSQPQKALRRSRAAALVLWAAAALAYVGAGLLNTPSGRCFYVMPFYLTLCLPLFYWLLGAIKLLTVRTPFTEIDREDSVERLRRCGYAVFILSALALAGNLVFLAQGGWQGAVQVETAFTALMAVAGGCALWLARSVRAITLTHYGKEKPREGDAASGLPPQP